MSLIPHDAPALLATFASMSECMARIGRTIPMEAVEIVDDPPPWSGAAGPRRHGLHWTAEEDARLLALWRGGASSLTMADHLERTREAVTSRIDVIKWGET